MKSKAIQQFTALLLVFAMLVFQLTVVAAAQETIPEESSAATAPVSSESTESIPPEPESSEAAQLQPSVSEPDPLPFQETETPVPTEEASLPTEAPSTPGSGLYFGQLHAHSSISDGTASPAALYAQAKGDGLDFFALTDHSHSFDNHLSGQIGADGAAISQDWSDGKAAAAEAASDDFVALFGYEMSWSSSQKIGHIGTFATAGFQSIHQADYDKYDGALETYYQTLSSVPGAIGQFNHPGRQYGTFSDFAHCPEADEAMALLELQDGDLSQYVTALDQGWHVAPSRSQNGRTVVYAQDLTEEDLYEAIRSRRVYATEDADLEIRYQMDGHELGSWLDPRHVGDMADITVTVSDPTDGNAAVVEVLSSGGDILATQSLETNPLSISLPAQPGYYFLKITQPDGDLAVTAPIWINAEEELGISAFTCETAVPVQNQEIAFQLTLYNGEESDFLVDDLALYADDDQIASYDLSQIDAGSTLSYPITQTFDCVGLTRIRVLLTGTLEGNQRSFEASLELSFHQAKQVTSILVDGSHGNDPSGQLTILQQMAMERNIDLMVSREEITAELLQEHRFFLIPAPAEAFSGDFLSAVAAYARQGGSLVVCGQGDSLDNDLHSAAELNRLLEALGASLTIQDDLAVDFTENGGQPQTLFLESINTDETWCRDVSESQTFRTISSATVSPGDGTWLVKGYPTTVSTDGDGDGLMGSGLTEPVLLAWEALAGGGNLVVSGSFFCCDEYLAEPGNIWAEPHANRTIAQTLLGIGGEAISLSTIRQAREGSENELFRIRGYVTAGTSNPYNTFPDMLYLQDDTGGIAITPFSGASIQQGTPVEITGYAREQNGNRILKLDSWKELDADFYQYAPQEGSWDTLLDPEQNGQRLVQVEGECQEIYCREDDTMAGCLLLDERGNQAVIQIEEGIGNGSDGENELHKFTRKGRTIRAMGLVHVDEYGDTVIRVRNCEEVVYVPPLILPGINPKTKDLLMPGLAASGLCSALALVLLKRKNKTSG